MLTKKIVMVSIHCQTFKYQDHTKLRNKTERIQERVTNQKRTKLEKLNELARCCN